MNPIFFKYLILVISGVLLPPVLGHSETELTTTHIERQCRTDLDCTYVDRSCDRCCDYIPINRKEKSMKSWKKRFERRCNAHEGPVCECSAKLTRVKCKKKRCVVFNKESAEGFTDSPGNP